jgi:hypothetical protein
MCELTWWQMASPAWLFRAKPAEYADDGALCMGVFWLPGLIALLVVHVIGLVMPVQLWLHLGWHPILLVPVLPMLAVWAVFVSADIKYRMQGTTPEQRWAFDQAAVNWFGFVAWPINLLTMVAGLVWWVVSLFV